ncbi:MAG: hypothetical protein RJA35_347 [Actinomycetota bacterium]
MTISQDAHIVSLSLRTTEGLLEAEFNALGARQVSLRFNGRNALQPYAVKEVPPFATGFTMAPWANRMRDGKWYKDGHAQTNPITEASTNTALHGLLLETVYDIAEQTESSVTFTTDLNPSDGYPFHVTVSVTYQLTVDGFTATHRAFNHSNEPAPYATGAHPYLYFEGIDTEDLEIQIPAESWTRVDSRLLPVATEPVSKHPVAGQLLAAGDWIRLGNFCIDNDFLDLKRDADGIARTKLRLPGLLAAGFRIPGASAFGAVAGNEAGDPRRIEIWQDESFPHVHVFSTPNYPVVATDGTYQNGLIQHGITIEPVTSGPDSFNTRNDLILLTPGQEWSGSWGISLLNW